MRVRSLSKSLVVVCLFILTGQLTAFSAPPLKDELRMPWTRNNERYIRHWLVVGSFPTPESQQAGKAWDTDYLVEHGGESGIRPTDGMTHARPGQPSVKWHWTDAWADVLGLSDAVDSPKENGVAYAFVTVTRPSAGRALLSFGSDTSLRAWVNGKQVLNREGERTHTPDEDQVEAEMNAGENAILVKLGFGVRPGTFSLRVLEPGAALARRPEISPSILKTSGRLEVKTDIGQPATDREPVQLELVGAGGKILFSQKAARGAVVSIDTASLPDGPYEIRVTTRTLAGRLFATHLEWYKGDSLAEASRLIEAAGRADSSTPDGFTLKMLADMVIDRLGGKPEDATGNPWWKIHSPLLEFEELKLEAKAEPARVRPYGFVRLAYRDEVDGSPQFCRAYLPAGYDPSKKWPLVLQLHGYNPANPPYVRWWSADSRHPEIATEFANHEQVIYLEPHGRGNTSYTGLGDNDILRVIALAKQRFNVDEDRVYLTGDSMGGWGTWNVGTRHPDLFAAIAPVYGGADYHAQMTEEELARLSAFERFRLEKQSSFALAENLLNMPIFIHHGDVDKSVNVEYSRWALRLLSRWGYNVRYREIPGRGHEALDVMNENIEWFLEHRRDPNPRHVRIRSAELRYASAYWARVEQCGSPMAFMQVDAEIVGPNVIRLDSENAVDIVLSPSAALVDPGRSVTVVWNGLTHEIPFENGSLRLKAADYSPQTLRKTRDLPGSIRDFMGTPFAIVIGTVSKDPEMVDMCSQKAEAYTGQWKQWQNQPPRVFKDTELGPADAARYSLILIGGPDDNAVTAQLADRLPVQLSASEIKIGSKAFPATNAAVELIRPNPLNPNRYVLLIASATADGMYLTGPDNGDLNDFDFTILDGHVPAAKQLVSSEKLRVASGCFDGNWQVKDELIVAGDPQARSESRLIKPPKTMSVNPTIFDAYTGRYQIEGGPQLIVSREGNRLLIQAEGDTKIELIPQSETEFFIKEVPVTLVFTKDSSGKVAGLTGQQNGRDFVAKKIE